MILVSECSGVLVSSYPGVLGFVIQFPLFYVQVKEKRKKWIERIQHASAPFVY